MRKVFTATIYGEHESICQDVFYNFEYIKSEPDFFEDGGKLIQVNYIKVMMPLLIAPSDIKTDLETAIHCELGLEEMDVVRIECEIQLTPHVVEQEMYNTDKLFV